MRKLTPLQEETLEIISSNTVSWNKGFGSRIASSYTYDGGDDLNRARVEALIGKGRVFIKKESMFSATGTLVVRNA